MRVKVTSLEEEVDHLKEEVKNKAGEITQLGSEAEKKEMEIEKQRGEIETYKQKQEVSYLPYCPCRKTLTLQTVRWLRFCRKPNNLLVM